MLLKKSVKVRATTLNANVGSFQVLDLAGFQENLRTPDTFRMRHSRVD